MVESYTTKNGKTYYYDLNSNSIARFPTNSNLLAKGSDNSLYFGNCGSEKVQKVFCDILSLDDINDMINLKFNMTCNGENVEVQLNINDDGQVQVKIAKDGLMFRLATNYSFKKMKEFDFTKMLMVIDFKKLEIRYKDPIELNL